MAVLLLLDEFLVEFVPLVLAQSFEGLSQLLPAVLGHTGPFSHLVCKDCLDGLLGESVGVGYAIKL